MKIHRLLGVGTAREGEKEYFNQTGLKMGAALDCMKFESDDASTEA